MSYLLDVNALLAWWHQRSTHHVLFHAWVGIVGAEGLHTCGMSELGFVRVSMQAYGYNREQAMEALKVIKKTVRFVETAPSPVIPAWVSKGGMTSDAYFAQVAAHHGLVLATFDRGIPGARIIEV